MEYEEDVCPEWLKKGKKQGKMINFDINRQLSAIK
jgi:hypothetical protein